MDANKTITPVDEGFGVSGTHVPSPDREAPTELSKGQSQHHIPRSAGCSLPNSLDEDSAASDMESQEAYRRRKTMLANERTNGVNHDRASKHGNGPKPRKTSDASMSSEGYYSELSVSTSDDHELDPMRPDVPQDDEEIGLTKSDRRDRKKRRRRAQNLDTRIIGTAQSHKPSSGAADRNICKVLFLNSLLVASWYLFSLSISIYNKWMFSKKYLDFQFPLFTTCLHMVVQFFLALGVLYFVPELRPQKDASARVAAPSLKEALFSAKSLMSRMFYLTRIGPCGAATGLDIGLGNMSMKFISLTFYTMCKSSSLAFVLTFAFIFRLEKPSVKLVAIIFTMTVGVIMMVAGEVDFNTLGFVLVILAAFFSGFRWSLTQILLLRSPATSNPFSSIFYLAPVMFLSLALIAVPVEGLFALSHGLKTLVEAKGVILGICILLFPGLLAFLMTASEFALLQRTSVVTLSICGIFKEVVTISAAGIVFHDPLTPINVSGLLITVISIGAYNYIKISKMRKDAKDELGTQHRSGALVHDSDHEDREPMLGRSFPEESESLIDGRSVERSKTLSHATPLRREE